jgi:seryl-tRNA synthetase
MATRRPVRRNNHLEEAMALLIRNQAAFVEQIARNDQERLKLQRQSQEWQLENKERWLENKELWRENKEWQRKAEERFDRIEQRLADIEASLVQLPKTILQTILEQLPKAIKKEIGFKPQR